MALAFKTVASHEYLKSLYFEHEKPSPNLKIDYFFLFAFLWYKSNSSQGYMNSFHYLHKDSQTMCILRREVQNLIFHDKLWQKESNRIVLVCS